MAAVPCGKEVLYSIRRRRRPPPSKKKQQRPKSHCLQLTLKTAATAASGARLSSSFSNVENNKSSFLLLLLLLLLFIPFLPLCTTQNPIGLRKLIKALTHADTHRQEFNPFSLSTLSPFVYNGISTACSSSSSSSESMA